MRYPAVFLLLTLLACQTADDHGHSHDTEGAHTHEEELTADYTIWSDKTELFVEFPVLIVGRTSRFAAHFTVLEGHEPVTEGSVTVSLIKGNKGIRQTVESPSSPGIFTPEIQPLEAGFYTLLFELTSSDVSDTFKLDSMQVFASADDAKSIVSGVDDDENAIAFLKEQAWKMEFQTTPVTEAEIFQTISTSGTWKVAPSDRKTLVAPAGGVVNFRKGSLTAGSTVRKGQILMSITSSDLTTENLNTEILKARAEFERVESAYERKKTLNASGIVPDADLELARQKYQVAKADYETLKHGFSEGSKQVAVPVSGFINRIEVRNGDFVDQGDALVTITSSGTSLLEVGVSPSHSSLLQDLKDIWYQPAPGTWSSLVENGGQIVSIGREVSPEQPLLGVFAEVNEPVDMPEGSFTEVQLLVGIPNRALVVPASSLLEDYGLFSVIVQVSGESFERRNVVTGRQNGTSVEILEGLESGEMVVSKGAYQVKMASMSGQAPAHGHAH